jgi:predicted ABC-type ATPase
VDLEGCGLLIDPDAIAYSMNPSDTQSVAFGAGREALRRTAEYLSRQESFAVETTLSSHTSLALIRDARSRGYETRLIYVALNTPEKNIVRVRSRVQRGGHFIPDVDVRRRYQRSIANLPKAIRTVDLAGIYDNSGDGHRLALLVKNGVVVECATDLPWWVQSMPR